MAFNLKSITRGKVQRPPRIVMLAPEKVGKSTFAGQAPNVIFIPIKGEEGIDAIDAAKFPVSSSLSDAIKCVQSLAEEEHEFKYVCVDSVSAIEPLIWQETCRRCGNVPSIEQVGGGFGKGYVESLNEWRELTSALDYLRDTKGMGCILIGHVKVKGVNNPMADPYDAYQFDLQERAAKLLSRWADATLFANTKVYAKVVAEVGDKKTLHATGTSNRILYTQSRPAHPGGCRYTLPYEMKLDFAEFETAYMKAAAVQPTV